MSVAVIVPAYNCQSTIKRCIESILKQTSKEVNEIIIVDDGSEDNTSEIVRDCQEKDQRIRLIQKKNGGVSSARNMGIRSVVSDWIMFVDSDDEIRENYIKEMLERASDNDLVVAGIDLYQGKKELYISHAGDYSAPRLIKEYGKEIPSLLINGPWAKLYRKEIIEKYKLFFDENISLGEDTLFVFSYLKHSKKITFIETPGYIYYQMGSDSLMTKFRADGYENAKNVYLKLMKISQEICDCYLPDSMLLVYKNVLMGYIRKLIYHRKQVNRKKLQTVIVDYANDSYVREGLERFSWSESALQKLLDKLVRKKKYYMIRMLLTLHVMIRGI